MSDTPKTMTVSHDWDIRNPTSAGVVLACLKIAEDPSSGFAVHRVSENFVRVELTSPVYFDNTEKP